MLFLYAVKVAHIVNFSTKKGAVRGNEARLDSKLVVVLSMWADMRCVVGRDQGEYAVKGDICGADQQALDISGDMILLVHDLLPAKDMFLVLYGKDMVVDIGIKRKRIVKSRKRQTTWTSSDVVSSIPGITITPYSSPCFIAAGQFLQEL